MSEDEKREIEDQLFKRLQSRAIIIGVPAIIALFLAFASLIKGEKGLPGPAGPPGTAPTAQEVADDLLKDQNFLKAVKGKDADIPEELIQNKVSEALSEKIGSRKLTEVGATRIAVTRDEIARRTDGRRPDYSDFMDVSQALWYAVYEPDKPNASIAKLDALQAEGKKPIAFFPLDFGEHNEVALWVIWVRD